MDKGNIWQFAKSGTTITLKDCHLKGHNDPICNKTQDVTLLSQSATATSFTVTFERKLVTGDPNDMDITVGNIWFQWSYTD